MYDVDVDEVESHLTQHNSSLYQSFHYKQSIKQTNKNSYCWEKLVFFKYPTCSHQMRQFSTGLTQASGVPFNEKITHAYMHWECVCKIKIMTSPLLQPNLKKKLTTIVSIKVCVCLTYNTALFVVCGSSWQFDMLRISHCSGPLQAGMETKRKTRTKQRQ